MRTLHSIEREETISVKEMLGMIWLHGIGYNYFRKGLTKGHWDIFTEGLTISVANLNVANYASQIPESEIHRFSQDWILR